MREWPSADDIEVRYPLRSRSLPPRYTRCTPNGVLQAAGYTYENVGEYLYLSRRGDIAAPQVTEALPAG